MNTKESSQYSCLDLDPPDSKISLIHHEENGFGIQNALPDSVIKNEIEEEIVIHELPNLNKIEEIPFNKEENYTAINRSEFSVNGEFPTSIKIEKVNENLIKNEANADMNFELAEVKEEGSDINTNRVEFSLAGQSSTSIKIGNDTIILQFPEINEEEAYADMNIEFSEVKEENLGLDKNSFLPEMYLGQIKLKDHENYAIETNTLMECDQCTYKTANKKSLKLHRRHCRASMANHTKLFKCDWCKFQSNVESSIKLHRRRHERHGVIKNECSICGYKTVYITLWETHIRQHGMKPYICDKCNYQTDTRRKLKWHSLLHKSIHEVTNFRCTLCPYSTRYQQNFHLHTLNHIRNFHKCSKCDFESDKSFDIRLHLLVHEND